MNSNFKRLSKTKGGYLSPFSSINFSIGEEEKISGDILTSYIKYKNYNIEKKLKKEFRYFLNPFLFLKKNNSTLSTQLKNNEKIRPSKIFNYIGGKVHINKDRNNDLIIDKKEKRDENKFRSKYKYLMRNISFNGNSKRSFKNLSNEILDDIFKDNPYNSIVTPNIHRITKKQKKSILYKFKKVNNEKKNKYNNIYQILNTKYIKLNTFKPINLNDLKNKKEIEHINNINKTNNNNFKNKDDKNNLIEFNSNFKTYYIRKENNLSKCFNSEKNENDNKKFMFIKKNSEINYGNKFHALKMKLRKQDNVNSNLINDIKKEQSLSKHKIQVGIVQLNSYKLKNRKLKKNI